MSLTIFGTEIPTNMDSLEVFEKDMDELEVFGVVVWKKQKYYYITYKSNGGTGSMSDQTMPCGTAAALLANLFNRIGYLFQGWNPDANGGVLYTDEQKVTDIAGAGETLILYAIWNAITWYVKYNANGGSGSMANQTHKYDTELALTKNAFTRTDYTFLGWGTTQSGDVVYADRSVVKNLKTVHGATLNLYAIWQHNGYYAIQYGKLVNCPNATPEQYGGHTNKTGAITLGNADVYGAYGHVLDSEDEYWGAYTGNLNTYGCKKLSFTWGVFETTAWGANSRTYEVYGDGALIKSGSLSVSVADEICTQDRTVDVSSYTKVAVRVRITQSVYNDYNPSGWLGAGFREVRLHN